MSVDIIPLVSFAIITTFTPGPNNISSASMGVQLGYRKTLSYLFGITSGFFIVMLICAYLSSTLLTVMPVAEDYLRWIGAGYILGLAVGILRSNPAALEARGSGNAFAKGFFLQLCNPKVAVYGLTIYATFLAPLADHLVILAICAAAFALMAFTATSTWALSGAVIKRKLKNDAFRKKINFILALLLVYTAVKLTGILLWAG